MKNRSPQLTVGNLLSDSGPTVSWVVTDSWPILLSDLSADCLSTVGSSSQSPTLESCTACYNFESRTKLPQSFYVAVSRTVCVVFNQQWQCPQVTMSRCLVPKKWPVDQAWGQLSIVLVFVFKEHQVKYTLYLLLPFFFVDFFAGQQWHVSKICRPTKKERCVLFCPIFDFLFVTQELLYQGPFSPY